MYIKKSRIKKSDMNRMKRTAGYRENDIMKKSNLVYMSEKGRCINFMDTRTGKRCQFDRYSGYWTN